MFSLGNLKKLYILRYLNNSVYRSLKTNILNICLILFKHRN